MAAKRIVPIPSVELLRKYARYEPATGRILWIHVDGERPQWNAQRVGAEAFSTFDGAGYKRGGFKGASLRAHRVAWALHYGEWPDDEIDHVNADRSDNRIENLRSVTRKENSRNRRKSKANTSGMKGVSWRKKECKWEASIKHNGKNHHLGLFDSVGAAHAAYCEAARSLHKQFARFE